MGKPSRRKQREQSKAAWLERKRQLKQHNRQRRAAGLEPPRANAQRNATCTYASIAEETEARTEAVTRQMQIIRGQLPAVLRRFKRIADPRNPRKLKHKLSSLLLYGILLFALHMISRRQANRELASPQIEANLRALLPDLDRIAHADTLYRLLRDLGDNVQQIEQALVALVRALIRSKRLSQYLINNCYPIAIDGTRKFNANAPWADELQQQRRRAKPHEGLIEDDDEAGEYHYHAYVLEASLCLHNGMVIPLMSEFLDATQGDTRTQKQDCELRAFERLAKRLNEALPRLPVMLMLDGLYAKGPVMYLCEQLNWQYMIVLKDACLPSVWAEYESLQRLQTRNTHQQQWGQREQHFRWVNDIEYCYKHQARERALTVHVVVCEEQWQVLDETGERVTKRSRHAWLSSRRLNRHNLHTRCNLGARHRWGIEAGFLVAKRQGYAYEHVFAEHWAAMRGYHYLMRLGQMLNTLARFSRHLKADYERQGVRGFLRYILDTLKGPWLDHARVEQLMSRPLRLSFP